MGRGGKKAPDEEWQKPQSAGEKATSFEQTKERWGEERIRGKGLIRIRLHQRSVEISHKNL